jgi:UrcA family protein
MRSINRMLLVSALAVTASSVAMADALVNVKSETVRYEDLRLTSPVGVAVLYGRIRAAAEHACASLDSLDLSAKARYRACLDGALAKAVADVDHPGLTQYYDYKRGLPAAAPPVTVPSVTVVAKAH